MLRAWHISCSVKQVEGTVHTWRGVSTVSERHIQWLDPSIKEKIRYIASEGTTYGYRRVWAVLRNSVTEVNQKTVRKVLKDNNLNLLASKHRVKTKKSNLFHPHGPDQLWETDITYIPTESGMTYLMSIKDCFTKEWVGISLFQIMYGKGCHTFCGECCSTGIQWISTRRPGAQNRQWSPVYLEGVQEEVPE